jgi:E3 ubiquitin-protein ligase MARCH6
MDKLIGFLMPISQTLNISGADPLAAGLFKSLYYGFGIQSVVIPEGPATNASVSQYFMNMSSTTRSPSLLSEISFLRNLTRYPSINQLIITIAEGYVITILVVVCFILVFLIREWVVQQQPGINMGAGFNAEFAVPERPRDQLEVPRRDLAARPVVGADLMANAQEPQDIRQRPMARLRRRNLHLDDVDEERPFRNNQDDGHGDDIRGDIGGSQNRPPAFRDALTPAAEIQKALTEEPRMTEEFLAIWRRADSDPQEVLRIIERENKGDQMRYWVNAMKILQNPLPQENVLKAPLLPPSGHSPQSPLEELGGPSGTNPSVATSQASETQSSIDKVKTRIQQEGDESSASSESWVDIEKPLESRLPNIFLNDSPVTDLGGENKYLDKGKNKAEEDIPEPIFDSSAGELPGISQASRYFSEVSGSMNVPLVRPEPISFASSSRPRSVSDGPQLKDSISPLANNNWSFSNLPAKDEKEDHTYSSVKENTKLFGPVESQSGNVPFENRDKGSQAGTQAWKAAQDLRVQQAIAKGREAHKSALERHTPAIAKIPPAESSDIEGPLQIQGQDGIIRTAQNWDEVFENNPVSDSEDEDEVGLIVNVPEADPFQPDAPLPEVREPVVARPAEPEGVLGHIAEFLWGGLGDDRRQDDQGANDEHIVQDLAAEAPFVPVAHEDPLEQGDQFPEQDREVIEAAIAAGLDPNDPDAMEDAEDFEGIMELVGMRGPIFSLVQNALFSAFLLALTVAFGVWIPYNIGRFFLLLIVNIGPACKLLLRSVFGCAALMQDLALSLLGVVSYCIIAICSIPMKIWSYYYATSNTADTPGGVGLGSVALNFSQGALDRIMDGTVDSLMHLTDSEIFAFSAASHESLMTLKSLIIDTLAGVGSLIFYIFVGDYNLTQANIWAFSTALLTYGWSLLASLPSLLAKPDTWVISLEVGKRVTPLDLELSVWDGVDRFWAILAGYTFLCLIGAAYVKKGSPFSSGQVGREWEATIIDLLNQAGGVMKVILIISIEMLVFPLYCGLLLDAALLPLFENTTIMSRILFTFKSPLTSIFVHWFVGTCYMFHFALFVSMCRKIMRKGVLCKSPLMSPRKRANTIRLHPRPR